MADDDDGVAGGSAPARSPRARGIFAGFVRSFHCTARHVSLPRDEPAEQARIASLPGNFSYDRRLKAS
jgi:hypothetical protein